MKALTRSVLAIFTCAVLPLTAFAGPEPMRDYKDSKTVVPVPPRCDWHGFYIGVNAGYTWSDDNSVDTVSENTFATPNFLFAPQIGAAAADLATFSLSNDNEAFIVGVQIGYNWQFGSWVAGVEADIHALGESDGASAASDNLPTIVGVPGGQSIDQSVVVNRSMDYIGTARGRFGRLVTPCLLTYATGGLAYADVSSTTGITQFIHSQFTPAASSVTSTFSDLLVGWTAGGGIEWMFASHWSLRSEYLYYDLGRVNYNVSPLNSGTPGLVFTTIAPSSSTYFDGHIVRAALNFHF